MRPTGDWAGSPDDDREPFRAGHRAQPCGAGEGRGVREVIEMKPGTGVPGLGRETLLYGLSTVVSGLVMLAFLPFMSTRLDAAEAGEVGTLRILAEVLAGVMVLGLPVGIVRMWQKEGISKRALVAKASIGCASAGLAAGLLCTAFGREAGSLLNLSLPSGILHAFLLGLGAALVQVALSFHRADGRPVSYFLVQASRGLLSLALLPVLFMAGTGRIESFLMARWIPALLAAAAALLLAFRFAPGSGGGAVGLFRYSLPLMPAGLALLILSSADMIMLRAMAPDLSESGYYEWASSACMALTPLTIGFGMAWHRHIFSLRGVPGGLAKLGRHSLVFVIALEAAAMLLALLSREAVSLVGGAEYAGAARVLPILAGSSALYGVYLVAQTGPLLEGRTWLVALTTIFGAAGNLAFNYRLIPEYGASGAALATLGTNLFMSASLFWSGRGGFPVNALAVVAIMAVPSAMGPLSTLPLPWRAGVALLWTLGSAALCRNLLGTRKGGGPRDA